MCCYYSISYIRYKRNKIFILLRSAGLKITGCLCSPPEPLRCPLRPCPCGARLHERTQSQQNNGFVSLAYQTSFLLSQMMHNDPATWPPEMSTLFRPGFARRRAFLASNWQSAIAYAYIKQSLLLLCAVSTSLFVDC